MITLLLLACATPPEPEPAGPMVTRSGDAWQLTFPEPATVHVALRDLTDPDQTVRGSTAAGPGTLTIRVEVEDIRGEDARETLALFLSDEEEAALEGALPELDGRLARRLQVTTTSVAPHSAVSTAWGLPIQAEDAAWSLYTSRNGGTEPQPLPQGETAHLGAWALTPPGSAASVRSGLEAIESIEVDGQTWPIREYPHFAWGLEVSWEPGAIGS